MRIPFCWGKTVNLQINSAALCADGREGSWSRGPQRQGPAPSQQGQERNLESRRTRLKKQPKSSCWKKPVLSRPEERPQAEGKACACPEASRPGIGVRGKRAPGRDRPHRLSELTPPWAPDSPGRSAEDARPCGPAVPPFGPGRCGCPPGALHQAQARPGARAAAALHAHQAELAAW